MEAHGVTDVGDGFLESPPLGVAALKVRAVSEEAVAIAVDDRGETAGLHGPIIAEEKVPSRGRRAGGRGPGGGVQALAGGGGDGGERRAGVRGGRLRPRLRGTGAADRSHAGDHSEGTEVGLLRMQYPPRAVFSPGHVPLLGVAARVGRDEVQEMIQSSPRDRNIVICNQPDGASAPAAIAASVGVALKDGALKCWGNHYIAFLVPHRATRFVIGLGSALADCLFLTRPLK